MTHVITLALYVFGYFDIATPGNRASYGPQNYVAFVRDLDGHKIEAMFRDASAG